MNITSLSQSRCTGRAPISDVERLHESVDGDYAVYSGDDEQSEQELEQEPGGGSSEEEEEEVKEGEQGKEHWKATGGKIAGVPLPLPMRRRSGGFSFPDVLPNTRPHSCRRLASPILEADKSKKESFTTSSSSLGRGAHDLVTSREPSHEDSPGFSRGACARDEEGGEWEVEEEEEVEGGGGVMSSVVGDSRVRMKRSKLSHSSDSSDEVNVMQRGRKRKGSIQKVGDKK